MKYVCNNNELIIMVKPKNGYGASEEVITSRFTSLMQRVAGSTVTEPHGARGRCMAHEYYVQPYPVTNS